MGNKGTPIGNNKEAIAYFQKKFEGVIDLDDLQVRTIIDTSISKMRNYASVASISDAEVTHFKVLSLAPKNQCSYCSYLNGKIFSVATAMVTIKRAVKNSVQTFEANSPFITSVFTGEDGFNQFKSLSPHEIQSIIPMPIPCHENCSCEVVAYL